MSGEDTFFGKFSKVTKSLQKLGLLPTEKVVTVINGLWKGSSSQKEAKEIQEALERFIHAVERIALEIEQYTDDQKKKSQLAVDVKTSLVAIYEWSDLVEKKRYPPDFVKTLQKKTDDLNESIQAEQLRFGRKVDSELNLVAFYQRLSAKQPLEYYNNGKFLITQQQWLQAKENLLAYQKFADGKLQNKLPSELGDVKVKDPHEDKHLEYLEFAQKKMDEKLNQGTDEISLLLSNVTKENIYTPMRIAWRAKYPYREPK